MDVRPPLDPKPKFSRFTDEFLDRPGKVVVVPTQRPQGGCGLRPEAASFPKIVHIRQKHGKQICVFVCFCIFYGTVGFCLVYYCLKMAN